jgi:hypothetical protein
MDDDRLIAVSEAVFRYTEIKMKIAEGLRTGFNDNELLKLEQELDDIDQSFSLCEEVLKEELSTDVQVS